MTSETQVQVPVLLPEQNDTNTTTEHNFTTLPG